MNKIFKVIWNHTTQTWVAVSELGKAKTKSKSQTNTTINLSKSLGLISLGTLGVAGTVLGAATADPITYDNTAATATNTPYITTSDKHVLVGKTAQGGNDGKIERSKEIVSIGFNTTAAGRQTIAIGSNASAAPGQTSDGSAYSNWGEAIAIGHNANANAHRGVAIGPDATISGYPGAVAVGAGAKVVGERGTAVGLSARALGHYDIAIGNEANTFNLQADGTPVPHTRSAYNLAVGYAAQAKGGWSIAVGRTAKSVHQANALGWNANASGIAAVAVGTSTRAVGNNSAAFGHNATANGWGDIALGLEAKATPTSGSGSVAIGQSARAFGDKSGAIGPGNRVGGDQNIGSSGVRSFAVGAGNSINGWGTYVLGNNVTVDTNSSVILGDASSQNGSHAIENVTNATVADVSYTGFSGKVRSDGRFVSVGAPGTGGNERKIINLAAGNISSTSTEAINGSQLYLTHAAINDVNNNIPFDYTKKGDKTPLVLIDGKYYPEAEVANLNYNPVTKQFTNKTTGRAATPTAVAEDQVDITVKAAPKNVRNVAGNLTPAYNTGDNEQDDNKTLTDTPANEITKFLAGPAVDKTNLKNMFNNAATVGDVLNAGWNLQGNGNPVDFVKPYDTVNFIDGTGTTVVAESADGKTSTVKINTLTQYTTEDGTPVTVIDGKGYPVGSIKGPDDQVYPAGTTFANGAPENGATPVTALTDNPQISLVDVKGKSKQPTVLGNVAQGTKTLDGTHRGDKKEPELSTPILPARTELAEAYKGLADLKNSNPNNALTVADAANLGWVVSSHKKTGELAKEYADDVRNANEVRFVGTGLATVSGKTVDDVRIITVDVKEKQQPVVYTDAAGNKLIKADDGKFYPADSVVAADGTVYPAGTTLNADGMPEPAATARTDGKDAGDVIASMNDGSDSTTAPMSLANVKGNLPQTVNVGDTPEKTGVDGKTTGELDPNAAPAIARTERQEAPTNVADIYNNAATVGDVLNAGWNLGINGDKKDFVKPYDTVNFVNGKGTLADVSVNEKGDVSDVTFNIDNGEITNKPTGALEGTSPDELQALKDEVTKKTADVEPAKEAVKEKEAELETAKQELDALAAEPEDAATKVAAKQKVADAETALAEAQKDLANKESLKTKAENNLAAVPNKVATVENVVNAVNNSGFNIFQDSTDTANHKALVNPADNVVFKAAGEARVDVTKEQDGTTNITYRVDLPVVYTDKDGNKLVKGEDGNFYAPEDLAGKEYIGDKYYPAGSVVAADGKVYPKGTELDENGTPVDTTAKEERPSSLLPKTDVIASMNNVDGDTTKPLSLSNVAGTLAPTYNAGNPTVTDGKADANTPVENADVTKQVVNPFSPTSTTPASAADLAKVYNNAATVGDVLNAGWNLQENGTAKDFVKPYDTVNFVDSDTVNVNVTTAESGLISNVSFKVNTGEAKAQADGTVADNLTLDPTIAEKAKEAVQNAKQAVTDAEGELATPTTDAEGAKATLAEKQAALKDAQDKYDAEKAKLAEAEKKFNESPTAENKAQREIAQIALDQKAAAVKAAEAEVKEAETAATEKQVALDAKLAEVEKAKAELAKAENAEKQLNNQVATVKNVVDAINGSGFNIFQDDATDANHKALVNPGDKVVYKAAGEARVDVSKEKDGVTNITYRVDLPVVYTDEAGNKLVKGEDGNFYKPDQLADKEYIDGKYYPKGSVLAADGKVYEPGTTLDPKTGNPDPAANATEATASTKDTLKPVENVIASMNNTDGSTTSPMNLANVAGNLPQTLNEGDKKEDGKKLGTVVAGAPDVTTSQTLPDNIANIYNNAATVGDVLNAGWNLQNNGNERDFVKPYDTVNFVNGVGTIASVETEEDGKRSNVAFNVDLGKLSAKDDGTLQGTTPEQLAELDKAIKAAEDEIKTANDKLAEKQAELDAAKQAADAAPDNADAKQKLEEAQAAVDAATQEVASAEKAKANADAAKAAVPNKVATVENVVEAVNNSGFKLKASEDGGSLDQDGTAKKDLADDAAAGTKATATKGELINPGDTVEMVAGKNLVVKHDAEGKITYSLAKDINVNSVTVETTGPKGEKGSPITMVSSPDNTLSLVAPQKDEQGNVTGVAPVTVNGIKGNLDPTYNAGDIKAGDDGKLTTTAADAPTKSQEGPKPADVAKMYNNAATVGDVLNAGWNLKENGGERDFVKPYDTVEFINGKGTKVTVETAPNGKSSTIKVDVETANISLESPSNEGKVIAAPKDLVEKLAEAEKAAADAKKELADAEKALADNQDPNKQDELAKALEDAKAKDEASEKAVNDAKDAIAKDTSGDGFATAKNVAEAINKSGWKATSAADGGTVSGTTEELINPGETVTFKAGKNIDLKQDGNNFTYSLAENINVNSVTVETTGPDGKKGSPITMVSSPDNTLSLVSTKPGDNGDIVVSPVTVNGIKGNLDPTYNAGDFKDKDGKLLNETVTEPTKSQEGPKPADVAKMYNNAATVGDVLNAGWNLQNNGNPKDFVKPYDTVNFIDGAGTTVTVETAKDGKSSTVKVDVNKGEITPNDDGSVTGPTPKELVEKLAEAEKAVADAEKAVADAEKALADNKEPEKVDELTQAVEAAKQKAADPELAKAVAEAKDAIAKDPSSNQVATAKNVADAINASGWTATSAEDGGKTTGTTKELINPGETVTFKSGTNIELKQDGNNFTYSLAENIKVNSVTVETADPTDPTKKGAPISMVSVPEEENTLAFVAPKKGEDGKIVAAPVTIQNINGSLPVTYNQGDNEIVNGKPTGNKVDAKDVNDVQEAPSADEIKKIYNNAATVGDVLNAGWNLKENGNARDFVKPYDTVEFINGAGTTVTVETAKDGKSSTVKVDVNTANISLDSSSNEGKVIAAPKELVEKLAEAEKALADAEKAVAEAEKALAENKDPAKEAELKQAVEDAKAKAEDPKLAEDIAKAKENIAKDPSGNGLVTAKNVADAINSSGWKVTSAANGGTVSGTTEEIINPGETVTLKAGKNIELKQEGNDFTYSLAENIKVNSVTVETADPTDPTKKGSPISMVSVPDAENTLAFVAPKTDANGNVVAAPVTIQNIAGNLQGAKKDGNSFDVAPKNARTEPENAAAIYNNAATVGDVLNAGWNLQNNGEARDFVKPYDAVNFVDGEGTTATVITSPDGKSSDIVYSVNVDGKTTEITYTNAAGETIYKLADGTYNTQRDGKGETVAPEMITGSRVSAILPTTSVGGKQVGGNINFGDSETASVSTNEAGDIVVNVNTGDITANEDEGSVAGPQVAAQKVLDEAKKKLAELPETATPEEKKAAEDAVVAAQKALNNAPNQVATAQNVADAISKSGFSLTAQGQNRSVVNPGETVDMRNTDGNIVISKSADNNDVVYNLARDINVDSVQFGEDGPKVQKGADGSIKVGDKENAPVAITNVAGNLPGAKKDGNSFDVAPKNARTEPENVAAIYNNAATVGDVLNAGWNLQNNGEAKDFVKPYDTVNFVDGKGTTATVTTDADGKVSNITYNVNVDGKTTEITYTNAAGDTIYKLADGTYNTKRDGSGQAVDAATITGNRVSAILPTTTVGGTEVSGNVNFNNSTTTEVKAENGNITVNVKTADINATPNGNVEGPAQALINKVKDAEKAVADANQAVADAQKALNENKDLSKAVELQQALDAAKAKAADPALAQAVAKAKEDLAKAPEANKVATAQNVAEAINASGWKATSAADGGTVSGTTEELINPSETVTFKAGKNIELKQNGNSFTYGLADNIEFNSVNVQEVNAGKVTADEVKVGDVVINNAGINAGNKVISNVAPGKKGTDAVNVDQLNGAVNNINKTINRNNKQLRAGIAGANAAAGLPQVYIPGKSMVAASAGTYKGQSAVAVGYSRASDNGKLIFKVQGNANTRGDFGGSVGVGYQW